MKHFIGRFLCAAIIFAVCIPVLCGCSAKSEKIESITLSARNAVLTDSSTVGTVDGFDSGNFTVEVTSDAGKENIEKLKAAVQNGTFDSEIKSPIWYIDITYHYTDGSKKYLHYYGQDNYYREMTDIIRQIPEISGKFYAITGTSTP